MVEPALPPPPLPLPPCAETQTFCLRWNNHKANLIEILDALIKVESYVDCTIIVDDQVRFKAHRVVLAANSPYFQSILQDVPMDHCIIIFPGVKSFEMRALLEYMYTGEVNVTQDQIPQIMRIAEELEVKGLFDMADLKEKFNKCNHEQSDRVGGVESYPAQGSMPLPSPSHDIPGHGSGAQSSLYHSSSAISNSNNISSSSSATVAHPSSSSSSPPYSTYKGPYSSPPTSTTQSRSSLAATQQQQQQHANQQQQDQPGIIGGSERPHWAISPSMPAAMLSAVYESAPDMNPLKRKKLSSISSMLMSRGDTPILRNVLAQSNAADSSQSISMLLQNQPSKADKGAADKGVAAAPSQSSNHSFNGADYSSDRKYPDEAHSPLTDRSFEDDTFDPKGSFSSSFHSANSSNQKPEWKRYKQYTRNDIMSAIQCVRDGMSALQASRKFGVPSRTLYDKVKKLGITTGRPMNRTMKRSPSNIETSAAFPYGHGYVQTEQLLASMNEPRDQHDHLPKDSHSRDEHSIKTVATIPQQAAALIDHALIQQALENRNNDLASREALHAMALAAAAHAAANRMPTSPVRKSINSSPTPSSHYEVSVDAGVNYDRNKSDHLSIESEHERERRIMRSDSLHQNKDLGYELEKENERDYEREHERDHDRDQDRNVDDEDDQVEDLSVTRRQDYRSSSDERHIARTNSPCSSKNYVAEESCGVIVPPIICKPEKFLMNKVSVKQELTD